MAFKKLIEQLTRGVEITEKEQELIISLHQVKKIKKGEVLLMEGTICLWSSLVIEGLFRSYYIDNTGKEFTLNFSTKGWWVADVNSFINKSPATYNIVAIEDSTILQISYDNLQLLYQKLPKLEPIFRRDIQQSYAFLQNRLYSYMSKTGGDRYEEFINQYPNLEQRVPQYMIASYLGITAEFLSKIRKKRLNKTK